LSVAAACYGVHALITIRISLALLRKPLVPHGLLVLPDQLLSDGLVLVLQVVLRRSDDVAITREGLVLGFVGQDTPAGAHLGGLDASHHVGWLSA
jgi:hypothetical protein